MYTSEREKKPNYTLVKFMFDNDILDLLVFVCLRFHKHYEEFKKQQRMYEAEDPSGAASAEETFYSSTGMIDQDDNT